MLSIHEMHGSDVHWFHRRLPPLHALTVFAAAAGSGSFSRAAEVLFVTQGAVSRQIQQLEKYLGCPLFVRHKRGLRLTAEGQLLLPVVDDALGRLAGACDGLKNSGHVLVLRMPPTFTARWFLPILPDLRALLPDVDVRITTYDAWEPEFERSDVDAAVVQGRGTWGGVESVALMPEVLTPVCSPQLAAGINSAADLIKLPLLHCSPVDAWPKWLHAVGAGHKPTRRGQTFDTLELALAAATRGQGVAIGDLNLVRESLRDGILVAPFAQTIEQGLSYYLVYPPDRAQQPKIRILREWLTESAKKSG
ncbi:MAG TPA: LysR substrate-binding domain-containing protein [Burkholderiaceae bacterium]|nr:LysR substrate-binding domain-containing protein [Burkholderiaceae bacterium]